MGDTSEVDMNCPHDPYGLKAQMHRAKGDVRKVLSMMSNERHMDFVLGHIDELIEMGKYEECLMHAVIAARTNNARLGETVGFMFLRADRKKLRAASDPLPGKGPFRIYRGVSGPARTRNEYGVAWTSDLNLAIWYAYRYGLQNPAVYQLDVEEESVAAFTNARNESEFIVLVMGGLRPERLKLTASVCLTAKGCNLEEFAELKAFEHFSGFVSVPIARGWPRMEAIPDKPGVYGVLRMNNCPPKFLRKSTGGRFKGKDPSVSIPTLRKKWVENASVLYVGQSGGKGGDATLRSRIERYLDFGKGENVGHWGGRYIWQLEEANDLLLCWKPSSDPRGLEKRLIGKFEKIYGRLPFANLQH